MSPTRNSLSDGRAVIPRKWRVVKDMGPVVLLAEKVVKALIHRRWPAVWTAVEVVDGVGFGDPLPVCVSIDCESDEFDAETFDALLAVCVFAVVADERRLKPDHVRFVGNVLSLGAVYHVSARGEVVPGAAKSLGDWAGARARFRGGGGGD